MNTTTDNNDTKGITDMTLYPDVPPTTTWTTSHRDAWLEGDTSFGCYVCRRPMTGEPFADCPDKHRTLVADLTPPLNRAAGRARVADQLAYNNAKLEAVAACEPGDDDNDGWLERIYAAGERLDDLAARTGHERHVDYLELDHELTGHANDILGGRE